VVDGLERGEDGALIASGWVSSRLRPALGNLRAEMDLDEAEVDAEDFAAGAGPLIVTRGRLVAVTLTPWTHHLSAWPERAQMIPQEVT
jgi:hypothetical protein